MIFLDGIGFNSLRWFKGLKRYAGLIYFVGLIRYAGLKHFSISIWNELVKLLNTRQTFERFEPFERVEYFQPLLESLVDTGLETGANAKRNKPLLL